MTWEEPNLADQNGVITSYTVTYRSLGAVDEGGRFSTSGTTTTLTDLEEFTQYEITVNASTAIGTGPGADAVHRTLGDGKGVFIITSTGKNKEGVSAFHILEAKCVCMQSLSKGIPNIYHVHTSFCEIGCTV